MDGKRYINILNLSAIYFVVWGIFVVLPHSSMFSNAPSLYKPMMELIPSEAAWGFIAIVTGIAAIYLGQQGRPSASLLMFIALALFAALFVLGDFQRPAWAIFSVLAIFNLLQWRYSRWTLSRSG